MASQELAPEAARGEVEAVHDKDDLNVMEETKHDILGLLYAFRKQPGGLSEEYDGVLKRLRKQGTLSRDEKDALQAAMQGNKPDAESAEVLVNEFFSRIENEKKHEVRTDEAREQLIRKH